jgi:type VII secretion-associated serine protease mycosin
VLSGPARRAAVLSGTAAVLACLTVAGGAAPALADSVRARQQWVLDAINVAPAWQVTMGHGVTVAVIDSGVNPDVPDLSGSVVPGPDLTGVGTPPSNPNWGMHGTWMASLIAGHGHDGGGSGIIGVAPQAKILSIRVITDKSDPGYAAYQRQPLSQGQQELAAGITDAVRDHAQVISMSLGYGAPSRPVRVALQYAFAHNVVVVASSGNSGDVAGATGKGNAPYSFPATYPGVLAVGAIGPSGQPASFSSENLSVQVAAPGVNVPAEGRDSQYWLVSGTSPACAITAGVAALIKSKYPRLTDAQVGDAITGSAWRRPPGGYDQQVGFGTVDAAAAVSAAARLAATAGPASQNVTASRHFGASAASGAPPVAPRGRLALVAYGLLGVACLAAVAVAALRLVTARSPGRHPAYAGPPPPRPSRREAPRRDADPFRGYPPGPGYPPGHGYQAAPDSAYPPANSAYPPASGNYPPGNSAYPPAAATQPLGSYQPGAAPEPGPAVPGSTMPPGPPPPGAAPLRPIPPRPYRPGAPDAGPAPLSPLPPNAVPPSPQPPGPAAPRPGDAGLGDGGPPGAIRYPRSSRAPGRHAAPAEPPPDPGAPR